MIVVNIEVVERYLAVIEEINKIPLEEIEWQRDGEKLEVSKELIEYWKFVGMNNTYFMQHTFGD